MADQEEKIAQFVGVVGCTPQQAKFFLEANNWELDAAMSSFFENPNASEVEKEEEETAQPAIAAPSSRPAATTSTSASRGSSSKIRGFRDLASDDDEEDSEDEGENYYAGGEKSGVMMKGPPKKPQSSDLVKDILDQAAKTGPPTEEFDTQAQRPQYFTGSGYTLSGDNATTPTSANNERDLSRQPVDRLLTFWRNGFSVDDGELRGYDDPENQEVLKAIKNGRAPTSILNVTYGQPVNVKVAHRLEEDYQPPAKKPAAAFSGTGHRLGSIVPGEGRPQPVPGSFPASSATPRAAQLSVDESEPITNIQIRLADGTRMVSKFNHTHSVQDIRLFINSSRPGESSRNYVLMTTFPNKELTDEKMTLKEAGLLNAVVVQKYF